MSSNFDTYGRLHAKSAFLSQEGVRYHLDTDNTKTITLKATPSLNGNVDVTLPSTAGELLNSNSNLGSAKLTGITALAQPGIVDADVVLFGDVSDANKPKGVLASALKTYVGAVPSGSDANILVNQSGTYASVAMSGDVTINNAGATSLQAGVVANAEVSTSANIQGTKINPTFGNQDVEVNSSHAFYIGGSSTDGSWRMRVVSGNIVWEKRESGSYVQKGSFTG